MMQVLKKTADGISGGFTMTIRSLLGIIVFTVIGCVFCSCGPSESDVVTPQVKKKIEEGYSKNGEKATFVKTHSFTQISDSDFMIEAIIENNGKRYLTPNIIFKRVEGKILIDDLYFCDPSDLNEL